MTLLRIIGEFTIGTIIRRANRFVLEVNIDGMEEQAHLRDPGRLRELIFQNTEVLLRRRDGKARKTKFEVIGIKYKGNWVLVNSVFHSDLAAELIKAGRISGLSDCEIVRREVKFGKSRVDFLLKTHDALCYLEVKGCTLVENGYGMFPDAPTERGARHVRELTHAVEEGYRAAILFVVMQMDANLVIPNIWTDLNFVTAMEQAKEKGVEMYAYSFFFDRRTLSPFRELKVLV